MGITALMLLGLAGCERFASNQSGPFKDARQQVSYAFGADISAAWEKANPGFDLQAVERGMKDGMAGRTRIMTTEIAQQALAEFTRKQQTNAAPSGEQHDKASYAYGYNTAGIWKTFKADVDVPSVIRGIKDSQAKQSQLSSEEVRNLAAQFTKDWMRRLQRDRELLAAKNLQEGQAFLKKNQNVPGVVTLPSGLQYKVLARGQGENPEPDNYVRIAFQDKLLDGTLINSSDKVQNKQCVVCLRSIVKGWQEALQLMKPGDRWQLFIPPDLGYGKEGAFNVGPNATLLSVLELQKILPGQPQLTDDQIQVQNSR